MTGDPADVPAFTTEPARHREPRWLAGLLFALVVLAVPVTTSALAVHRFPELSTLDEFAHIDYLRRVEDGHVPRVGDKVLPETARDVACRTIEGRTVGDCQSPDDQVSAMDAEGYSYEAQQPPLYYAATAVLRQPVRLVVNGYVNSARLTGALWLAAGLAVLWWFVRRRMGADLVSAAVVCGIVGITPSVVAQASVVNNDAAAVLSGAVLLVTYDELRRRRTPWRIAAAALVGVVVVLIKPLSILGVGALTIALLVEAVWRRRERLPQVALLVLPALASGFAYQAWQMVRDHRATVPYSDVLAAVLDGKVTLHEYPFESLGALLPRLLGAYWSTEASMFTEDFVVGITMCVGLLFVSAPSLSAALGQSRRDLQPLHIGLLVVMLLAPLYLVSQAYFQVHKGGGVNARYALTLLPLTVTAVVPWLQSRGLRVVAATSVGLLATVTYVGLLTHELGAA